MTPEAFHRIEQAFGVTLPDWYRWQIVEYPLAEPDDALYSDEESIVRTNRELRSDGWFRFPWPREFFIIGDDGCGDYYFIVPCTGDKRIFTADHEGGPAPVFDKLSEMIVQAETMEQYVSGTQEIIRDVSKIRERRRNKKWWQFWI